MTEERALQFVRTATPALPPKPPFGLVMRSPAIEGRVFLAGDAAHVVSRPARVRRVVPLPSRNSISAGG